MHSRNPRDGVGASGRSGTATASDRDGQDVRDAVAVVGMALRVPGSAGLDAFWTQLADGVESVTRFTAEELREAGIPDAVLADPHYVRAKPVLADLAGFDARFFGLTPREAQVRDPQHRLFLECAYTALEHAGYDPFHMPGTVGVYGGGAPNFYREWNVAAHPEATAFLGEVGVMVGNAADYLTTAVSHHLGLTGPSVNVATACSTSLVAVHTACQALRAGECDAAVAGGVQVELPRVSGYHAAEGGMFSVTGRVRPFDADADGTVFGTGVGTVVLKRYADALAAGDHVHALVRASALNNDGNLKAGFTAPSVEGQAALIRRTLRAAGIDPGRIGYIEAHGTGTRVGDPVEVNALTRAYRDLGHTGVRDCPLGSVKGNIGHLGPAAGVVGLIKTVLALQHGRIPPSINHTRPHPAIDFDSGPFRVITELADWPAHQDERLAAVSSFGVGGTNAHVIVQQAPERAPRRRPATTTSATRTGASVEAGASAEAGASMDAGASTEAAASAGAGAPVAAGGSASPGGSAALGAASRADVPEAPGSSGKSGSVAAGYPGTADGRAPAPGPAPRPVVLPVSARTPEALAAATGRLAAHIEAHPGQDIEDVGATLALGRPAFRHRLAVVPGEEGAPAALRAARTDAPPAPAGDAPLAFLFPGQGSQHLGMGKLLYAREAVFRETVDRCAELARPLLDADLREVVFAGDEPAAAERLTRTAMAQPALFTVEYALARQLLAWGLAPAAMAGHSVGEYVAACLAGVFSEADAVRLVARRGALVQELPGGGMLAVPLPAEEAEGLEGLDVAAYNGARLTVLSGPHEALDAAQAALAARGVTGQRLHTSHAFHSAMMEPALEPFAAELAEAELSPPTLPFVSNVTGTWITDEEAVDPAYWTRHLRAPVLFAPGVARLLEDGDLLFAEVGPGQVLTALTRAQARRMSSRDRDAPDRVVVPTMPMPQGGEDGPRCLARAVARLWTAGAPVDWRAYWGTGRRRVPLPTYPFQRTPHWLDAAPAPRATAAPATATAAPAPATEATTSGTAASAAGPGQQGEERRPIGRALFRPGWREDPAPPPGTGSLAATWLVLRRGEILDGTVSALRRAGGQVVTAEPGDRFARLTGSRYLLRPGVRADYDALAEALAADGLWPERILHGWLFGPPDAAYPEDDTGGWLDLGFFSVLFLAQVCAGRAGGRGAGPRWDVVGSRLRAVSGAEPVAPARAAVTGVCDVLAKELPESAVRCLDVAELRFAPGLLEELARAGGRPAPASAACADRWIALRGRRRWLPHHTQVPEPRARGTAGPLRERGTYLITGGLGGIGLAVAEGLAKAVRARLVLTARSPFPPREEWDRLLAGPSRTREGVAETVRRLRRLEEYGARVLVCRADVADEPAMRAVVERAEGEFGPVDGVFHTAGVPGGGLLALKTRAEAERVMAAKVTGTLVLDRLLGERVELMVLFSSITSVAGNLGQTDYAAANAFLDAYAHARAAEAPGFTVSVNWDAWAEVGMAARADALAPAAFRALQAGTAAPAVGSLASAHAPHPPAGDDTVGPQAAPLAPAPESALAPETGSAPEDASAPVPAAPPAASGPGLPGSAAPAAEPPLPAVHPLLGDRTDGPDGRLTYRTVLDGETHWVSREHRVAGTPVWPATAYLEMARAAAADALRGDATASVRLRLTDVTFLAVLVLTGPTALRTVLTPEGDGYRFSVAARADGQEWTEHAAGHVAPAPDGPVHLHDLQVLRECLPVVKPDTEPYEPETGLVDFGPRWTSVAELRRDDSSTLARIELPEPYRAEPADYPLHPALFDAATSNAVYLPELGPTGESYLPFSLSRLTLHGPLPPTVHVYSRRRGAHRPVVTFDLTLTDGDGREVADVTGYTVRVRDPAGFRDSVTARARPAAPAQEQRPAPQGGLGGEFAIRPEEGIQALWHILGDRIGPQVVVIPEGLDERLRAVEALTSDVIAEAGRRSEAPAAAAGGADLPAPRPAATGQGDPGPGPAADSVHERLAKLWSEALGIDDIGPDDDFFAFGGNSLVGVQLAARVRREFDTDLPIATLIENPTVRAIAGIISA
ncbi:SDR family NAD(P)-dependent oxidoreductase [Streptomyces albus subsp. chlorinus]|uniref:type I polyketide synthase n=1 Tax=Streptomyces albus TaxID=1888 RepID=UPI0015706324